MRAGALQVTDTIEASGAMDRKLPAALQAALGVHITVTSAPPPLDSFGAAMFVSPTPNRGGCQPDSGAGVDQVAVPGFEDPSSGFSGCCSFGVIRVVSSVVASGVAIGAGVAVAVAAPIDNRSGSPRFVGELTGVGDQPVLGRGGSDTAVGRSLGLGVAEGNEISVSPSSAWGKFATVAVGSGVAELALTAGPIAPATPRTSPPARHAPKVKVKVRGVSCILCPAWS